MRLHDKTISHIARLLQVAIITGTDVVDHMRMIRLEETKTDKDSQESLILQKEYSDIFDGTIEVMLENAKKQEDKQ
jgi:hypothetical protein